MFQALTITNLEFLFPQVKFRILFILSLTGARNISYIRMALLEFYPPFQFIGFGD
jgi:hypothetical protein